MFGTIHYCLERTVIENYGEQSWKKCLVESGFDADFTYASKILQDLPEEQSIELFSSVATTLQVSVKELFDQFGVYWCCTYAPEIYPQFFAENKSTKEFILSLDALHTKVTSKKPNSKPPAFTYNWIGDKLEVTYISQRNLFELFISLLKGLDTYFQSETVVDRIGSNKLNLTFLGQRNSAKSSA